jgi:glycosyltransferase involved in cell wall biosynthesis
MEQIDRKHNSPITFVIFTYNEEQRVEWTIKNFSRWGPVLVVDNFSEDRTVEIAKSYGCEVLLNKNPGWCEDSETVAKVKAAVKTDWIYWASADEMVDESTLSAITEKIHCGKFSIINVIRKNFYYGKFCHNAYAHRMNRIFQKNAIDFSTNTIHDFGVVTVSRDQICYLDKQYYVRHFMSNTASSTLRTMDRYTDIQLVTYNKSLNQFTIAIKLIKTLLGNYFIRGAYKAGFAGLSFVIEMMYYDCLLAMKAYERLHGLNVEEIEGLNNSQRRSLLKSS